LNSKREQDNHGSPDSVPGDRHPGEDDHYHHGHHHGHENPKHDPSETSTPTSAPPHVPSPTS